MKKNWIWIIVLIIVLAVAWYFIYGTSPSPSNQSSTQSSTQTPLTSEPVLYLGSNTDLGSYLVASNKMTLYTYSNDTPGLSTCTGDCSTKWPPYIVPSSQGLTADSGISGTLGTFTRDDGTLQLTYNEMPLYFWGQDVNPGDTNGNGVAGLWSVAKP